jgi:putative SOS response-associated peptidase YedK
MCGRFVVARATGELTAELDIERVSDDAPGISYNVAPTTRIRVVVDAPADEPVRRLEAAKWGLVPSWAKDESVAVRAFNARSETAASKPTFRAAVKQRRGVIPVDGYYEWHKRADGSKQPYYVHPQGEGSLLLAALYEWWKRPDAAEGEDAWLLSATILTRASATDNLQWLHDRTPVFLDRGDVDEWLDPAVAGNGELVTAFADRALAVSETLQLRPVGKRVGNVRENDEHLIDEVEPEATPEATE